MNGFEITEMGKPQQWLIEAAAEIGLDYSRLTHEVTSDFRNHVIKRHGDPAYQGAATITDADFNTIPSIVKEPDIAIIGAYRAGLCNVYVKIVNNKTLFYFDDVLDSRKNKSLRGSTFYKVTRPFSLERIIENVTRNDKTDISKAKILIRQKNIQATGGHPGG